MGRNMAIGPGNYDEAATVAREATKARGVALIVFHGEHGSGFSCQMDRAGMAILPDILENMAREIRADMNTPQGRPEDGEV